MYTVQCNSANVLLPIYMFIHNYVYTLCYVQVLCTLFNMAITVLQAIVGDQLMCKTIRGSKRWGLAEVDPKERLTWAHEIPGKFKHALCTSCNLFQHMF